MVYELKQNVIVNKLEQKNTGVALPTAAVDFIYTKKKILNIDIVTLKYNTVSMDSPPTPFCGL
jgi:hypothetical protein